MNDGNFLKNNYKIQTRSHFWHGIEHHIQDGSFFVLFPSVCFFGHFFSLGFGLGFNSKGFSLSTKNFSLRISLERKSGINFYNFKTNILLITCSSNLEYMNSRFFFSTNNFLVFFSEIAKFSI